MPCWAAAWSGRSAARKMSGAFNAKRPRRRPTINITSLIDVMFLLLIFFMVSSTFREQLGIDVSLPRAATGEPTEHASHEIVVTAQGDYYFGQQAVDEGGLRASLVQLLEEEPEAELFLRADEKADFGKVIRAFDIAREVGGTKLVIPIRYDSEGQKRP